MEKRTAADILERVAQRYPNVRSRQSVLSNIKKILTKDERYSDVVKDLCLPTECYHQNIKEKSNSKPMQLCWIMLMK